MGSTWANFGRKPLDLEKDAEEDEPEAFVLMHAGLEDWRVEVALEEEQDEELTFFYWQEEELFNITITVITSETGKLEPRLGTALEILNSMRLHDRRQQQQDLGKLSNQGCSLP